MKFAVLAYNFPHWKTQNGLINLVCNGFYPTCVYAAEKKTLSIPQSNYRITPKGEYLQEPETLCEKLGVKFYKWNHDEIMNIDNCDFGVILGARIIRKEIIERFKNGILNIHPGILPGNRGLDNLKWSLIKGLPIGVTAHFIDERVDMGWIVRTETLTPDPNESIRDLYNRQRNLEQKVLIETMKDFKCEGINKIWYTPVERTEKFSAVPDWLDKTWF